MSTSYGPKLNSDGLVLYIDPKNPKPHVQTYVMADLSNTAKELFDTDTLNITDAVPWVLSRFDTYDVTPTSAHVVGNDRWYMGFTLNGKTAINYTTVQASLTLDVSVGSIILYLGSSGGGFTEGSAISYGVGTHKIDRVFEVGINYTTHSVTNDLQFCMRGEAGYEATISNLDVRERRNDAVLVRGVTTNAEYFTLDGLNDFIGTTFRTDLFFSDNDDFTLSGWFKVNIDVSTNGGLINNQLYYTQNDPGGFGMSLQSPNTVSINLTDSSLASYERQCPITYTTGEWMEMTYTYSSSSGTISGYKNGELTNTSTNLSYNWTVATTDGLYRFNRGTHIGYNTQGGWGNFYPMDIGPVKIYNRALSDSEILKNYNSLKSRFE